MHVKIGICQLKVVTAKEQNVTRATEMILEAVSGGADLVVLPEMFNCPYQNELFPRYAEAETTGETVRLLADLARKLKCWIVGGSIPERENDRFYNTSFVFDRQGRIIAKHRKLHLFDIDIPGGVHFKESAVISPGDKLTIFETPYGKFGLAICYDIRFPELFRKMADEGVLGVIVPAAFNTTTGPAHWELLFRGRAVDYQCYMIGAGPARNPEAEYQAFGHSIGVDPWGEVLWHAGEEEAIGFVEIDPERVAEVRRNMPLREHRRKGIY